MVSTSRATTTLPPASDESMWVMCAYPAGVTSQPPSSSPAAASKPADTKPKKALGYAKQEDNNLLITKSGANSIAIGITIF